MSVDRAESNSDDDSFGDDFKVSMKGKGKILSGMKDGRYDFISNGYYVSNMNNNI